ncbi:hypothetical protein [Streptomyces roseoverticillatus]|uniref:Uncharacterized protein n=1 Tax=Streptomyces roseoverticillatus TaxID=66429 RepID=A0ABV3ILI6_9ACTN
MVVEIRYVTGVPWSSSARPSLAHPRLDGFGVGLEPLGDALVEVVGHCQAGVGPAVDHGVERVADDDLVGAQLLEDLQCLPVLKQFLVTLLDDVVPDAVQLFLDLLRAGVEFVFDPDAPAGGDGERVVRPGHDADSGVGRVR